MPKLRPENIREEILEDKGMNSGMKIVRKKDSDDIVYGSPFGKVHEAIAKDAGIDPADVAYAAKLHLNKGVDGGINMYPGGSSIEGYDHSPKEEEETHRILTTMIKSLSEDLELKIERT